MCGNCKYGWSEETPHGDEWFCHRHAPIVIQIVDEGGATAYGKTLFPSTYDMGYCGDWKRSDDR
jgi:hypothetical protein